MQNWWGRDTDHLIRNSNQKSPVCVSLCFLMPQIIHNCMQTFILYLQYLHRILPHLFYGMFSLLVIATCHWKSQTITLNSESWVKDNFFVNEWIFILSPGDAPFFSNIVTPIQCEDIARPCLPMKLQQNHSNKKGLLLKSKTKKR